MLLQLLNEFQRYQGLLERPKVLAAVRPNREQLVAKLIRAMEDFNAQLDSKVYPVHLNDMSETINQIYHLRQMKYKVIHFLIRNENLKNLLTTLP